MTIFLFPSALPYKGSMGSIGGDNWGSSHVRGSMGRNEWGGMDYRGGVDNWSGKSCTVYHRAAVVADGGGHAADHGAAVNSRSQESGTSGGKSQESRQHHQFEHFDLGLCCTVDKLN